MPCGSVTHLTPKPKVKARSIEQEARLRRLAVQLATQMPEDAHEAVLVLEYTRELVEGFLARPRPV